MRTVLGISPGTRLTGMALLKDNELVDWKIHTSIEKWSPNKLREIIHFLSQYIFKNSVEVVCVKIPDELPVSKPYIQLIGVINSFCERNKITVRYYTLSNLTRQFCPNNKSKKGLVECMAEVHPELFIEFRKEIMSKRSYYGRVFEALAASKMYK